MSLGQIRTKLGETAKSDELGWDGVTRIQDRIFGSFDDPDLDASSFTDENLHSLIDSTRAKAGLGATDQMIPSRRRPDEGLQASRLPSRRVIGSVIVVLATVAASPIVGRSMPGDLGYPVKVQVESVRLAVNNGLDRASVQIGIGHDRLRAIRERELTSYRLAAALGDLEAAEVDALDLISRAEPSRSRTKVAGGLSLLAQAHVKALSRIRDTRSWNFVSTSLSNARWILSELGSIAGGPKGTPQASIDPLATPPNRSSLRPQGKRQRGAGTGNEAKAAHKEPASQGAGARSDSPKIEERDESCAVTSGSVCVTVPDTDILIPDLN